MNSITVLSMCLVLMLMSLITVSAINSAQRRGKLIRDRVNSLRRRVSEMEELCTAVEPLLESVLIPKLINEEVIELIHTVVQLDTTITDLDVHLTQAQQLANELSADRRTQPLSRLMPSDAAIAKGKYYLTEAARLVRKCHARGKLQQAELEAYIRELYWAHLMVDVISFVGHGHKAVTRGDTLIAYSFYRKAQNALINANMDEQRRHRYIRELGEILTNKRPALSMELMPETEYNPQRNTQTLPQENPHSTPFSPGQSRSA